MHRERAVGFILDIFKHFSAKNPMLLGHYPSLSVQIEDIFTYTKELSNISISHHSDLSFKPF